MFNRSWLVDAVLGYGSSKAAPVFGRISLNYIKDIIERSKDSDTDTEILFHGTKSYNACNRDVNAKYYPHSLASSAEKTQEQKPVCCCTMTVARPTLPTSRRFVTT